MKKKCTKSLSGKHKWEHEHHYRKQGCYGGLVLTDIICIYCKIVNDIMENKVMECCRDTIKEIEDSNILRKAYANRSWWNRMNDGWE